MAMAGFYSIKGVDDFSLRYLIVWVSAFIGMSAGAAAIHLLRLAPDRRIGIAAAAVIALACFADLARTPQGLGEVVDVAASRDYVAAAKAAERMVRPGEKLGLVIRNDAETLAGSAWAEQAAVNAILNRDGNEAVCIQPDSWILPLGSDFPLRQGPRPDRPYALPGRAGPRRQARCSSSTTW